MDVENLSDASARWQTTQHQHIFVGAEFSLISRPAATALKRWLSRAE